VSLESLGTLVCKVAADLTVVADVQPMQFVQPVWNWLQEAYDNTHHYNSVPTFTILTLYYLLFIRFEVFTAVAMKNGVFWDVTPCVSCKNRRFGGT
jgi:hypothetical protein